MTNDAHTARHLSQSEKVEVIFTMSTPRLVISANIASGYLSVEQELRVAPVVFFFEGLAHVG